MKYILVTGAGGGMGAATVKLLAERGYGVFALDKKAGEAGKNIIPAEADVTDAESLKKGSRIIITTSELAPLDPLPFTGIYAVSKGALDKYAYSLRMELQLLGICVSVIRAGAVKTGMLGVSTKELENFCGNTQIYRYNAARFRDIVDSVEAKSVLPEKIAMKTLGILQKKNPAFAYGINRNPLLRLRDAMPKRIQLFAIRRILK